MIIQLKPLKLEKKKGHTAHKGNHQSITFVLIIAMLADNYLYKVSMATATAIDPNEDRENYQIIQYALRNWANSPGKEIAKYPDNGPRETRTGILSAMWYGKTFKEHVSAAIWNLAVTIFDQVYAMNEADQAKGEVGVTYWWDSSEDRVIRIFPLQPEAIPTLVATVKTPIRRRWWPIVALAASVLLCLILVPKATKPAQEPNIEEFVSTLMNHAGSWEFDNPTMLSKTALTNARNSFIRPLKDAIAYTDPSHTNMAKFTYSQMVPGL